MHFAYTITSWFSRAGGFNAHPGPEVWSQVPEPIEKPDKLVNSAHH
jgi:hypothetical protein